MHSSPNIPVIYIMILLDISQIINCIKKDIQYMSVSLTCIRQISYFDSIPHFIHNSFYANHIYSILFYCRQQLDLSTKVLKYRSYKKVMCLLLFQFLNIHHLTAGPFRTLFISLCHNRSKNIYVTL